MIVIVTQMVIVMMTRIKSTILVTNSAVLTNFYSNNYLLNFNINNFFPSSVM